MSHSVPTEHQDRLADDLIFGVRGERGIAAFIGITERKARYLIDRKAIPVTQFGRTIIASKARLRRVFLGEPNNRAPP